MNAKLLLVLSLVIFSQTLRADVLQVIPGTRNIHGVFVDSKAFLLDDRGTRVDLDSVGAALVTKTILRVPAYVGEFFVADKSRWVKPNQNALDSISSDRQQRVVAMRMAFVHSASEKQLKDNMRLGLEANNIHNPVIDGILNQPGSLGDISASDGSQSLYLTVIKLDNGQERAVLENTHTGLVVTRDVPAGFGKDLFAGWFGNLADSGLSDLKFEVTGIRR